MRVVLMRASHYQLFCVYISSRIFLVTDIVMEIFKKVRNGH